jgi:ubiquinone biosynthesis monooxygenase Coq7
MMWIWFFGGAALGGVTALLGREAILACTEAVEQAVHQHLRDQIAWAEGEDRELAATIRSIQIEEDAHIQFATEHRHTQGFGWLKGPIGVATEGLIWISTRGDSSRLARQLRVAVDA